MEKSDEKLQIFEAILSGRSLSELQIFLQGSTDTERSKFATKAIANYKAACKPSDATTEVGGFVFHTGRSSVDTFDALAVLVTASEKQLKNLTWGILLSKPFDFSILKELKPKALRSFGDVLLEQSDSYFNLVLELCKIGVCQTPTSDAAVLAWQNAGSRHLIHDAKAEEISPLLLEPNFLNDTVWRFFESNSNQGRSLASLDRYRTDGGWAHVIKSLAEQGHISRDRLLRESLKALSRDFPQNSSSWFSNFHELLEPSKEERIALTEQYANLLGSTIPPTVSFAVKALTTINKSQPLPQDLLVKYIPLTFTLRQKGPIVAALALLEHGATLNPAFAQQCTHIAVNALQHDDLDVQAKVCDILERFANTNDVELSKQLKTYADTISSSARRRLRPLLGLLEDTKLQPVTSSTATYVSAGEHAKGWPLTYCERVVPIQNAIELLSKAAYCLEHPHLVTEMEQVTDAIARIPIVYNEPTNNLIAPLRARALKLLTGNRSNKPQLQIAYADFIQCALEPAANLRLTDKDKLYPLVDFVQLQFKAILHHIKKGIYLPLLSTPTHIGGWIEATQLIERHKVWNAEGLIPTDVDLTLTLLRTPEEERAKLAIHKDVCIDLRTAIETVGSTAAVESISQAHQTKDSGSALCRAARYMRGPIDTAYLPDFGTGALLSYAQELSTINLQAICLPALRECVLAAGVRQAAVTLDGFSAYQHGIASYFSLLSQSGAPLETKAYELMAIGLIHSDVACLVLTRDACICAIDERRLSVSKLGRRLSAYIHSGKNRPKRLVASLSEIARLSETHASAVIQILESTLQGEMRMVPFGLASLLELYQELLVEQNGSIKNSDTRKYLEALPTGGKTAKLAKALLAM